MKSVIKGSISGLVATGLLSVFIVINAKTALLPELDIIPLLAGKIGVEPAMGWLAHFLIGIVIYGIGFSYIKLLLPARHLQDKGVTLGIIGWLIMMVLLMPILGYGFFGMEKSPLIPVITFATHYIFGIVLGSTYKKLTRL